MARGDFMIYLTSDIHGEYQMFMDLLKLINFSDNDKLYILGDVADRGPEPIKIYQYIMGKPNVFLLRGNHEEMMLDALRLKDNQFVSTHLSRLWMNNGGFVTVDQFLNLPIEEQKRIYDFIKNTPLYVVINNNILIHAGLPSGGYEMEFESKDDIEKFLRSVNKEYLIWDRDMHEFDDEKIKGYHIWCGHTPTLYLQNNNGIYHRTGFSVIDGGACFDCGALNCICLDNGKEFSIQHKQKTEA